MGIVKFNGVSTDDLGLIVQFIPTYQFSEREYEKVHIPGRNGDLIIGKGSFQNVERTYSIAKVFKQGERFVNSTSSIVSWLHSANGYARLEDSYEPEYYRMAMYKSEGEFNNFYNEATALDITFECKPQRYLVSGDKIIVASDGDIIKNPTGFDAMPIITFDAGVSSVVTIEINDISVTFDNNLTARTVVIDCENMECYDANSKDLLNSLLTLNSGEFPKLKANISNVINITNANSISIKPRWWTL